MSLTAMLPISAKKYPWITFDVKKEMHDRERHNETLRTHLIDWAKFERLQKKVNWDIRIAKEFCYEKIICCTKITLVAPGRLLMNLHLEKLTPLL